METAVDILFKITYITPDMAAGRQVSPENWNGKGKGTSGVNSQEKIIRDRGITEGATVELKYEDGKRAVVRKIDGGRIYLNGRSSPIGNAAISRVVPEEEL